ncbi:TIGR04197 family type VII secretion effector [Pueribacillus sp. YX66]|uniref:TIGR04197 family type VII secretion effector n=1 Tax=Pueribacillus sp. YX66 TaxID=3229242 RepID=UPI00358D2B9A
MARRVVTKLENALQSFGDNHVSFATQTTVKSNIRAKETIQTEKKVVRTFTIALQQDIERIRSVAEEFETMGVLLRQGFNKLGK